RSDGVNGQGGDISGRQAGRYRTPATPPVGAFEQTAISPGIEGSGSKKINGEDDAIAGHTGIHPAIPAIYALKYATGSASIEGRRDVGIKHEGKGMGGEGSFYPHASEIRAFEDAAVSKAIARSPGIEGGGGKGINGQGVDIEGGQAGIDRTPA